MTDLFETLLSRIAAAGVGANQAINPFWREQLGELNALVAGGADVSPKQVRKAVGYHQRPLPSGVRSNRDLPNWPALMRGVELGEIGGLGKAVEHVASLSFLAQRGVLDDYIALADELRIVSDIGLARQYWYSLRLIKALRELDRLRPQVFMEVGGGSGRFASLMVRQRLVSHYILVDLPEMLLNAVVALRELPGIDLRFGDRPDFTLDRPTFWLLETTEIDKVPNSTVDVSININSFMEMAREVRDFYIDQIYRISKAKAVFYNVNRRQSKMTERDGRPFDNHPLFYPYRASDEVVEWEPDALQQSTRSSQFGAPVSFCISRLALVGPR